MQRRLVHDEEQERAMNRCMRWFLVMSLFSLLPVVHAAELGRLFYTPQQRQQLEYQSVQNDTTSGGARGAIIVNGVVQRHGGKRTVWINGVPQIDERGNDKNPASVSVSVPGKKQPVQTKVGQKILLDQPAPEENK